MGILNLSLMITVVAVPAQTDLIGSATFTSVMCEKLGMVTSDAKAGVAGGAMADAVLGVIICCVHVAMGIIMYLFAKADHIAYMAPDRTKTTTMTGDESHL